MMTENNIGMNNLKPQLTDDVKMISSSSENRCELELAGQRRKGCIILRQIERDENNSKLHITRYGIDHEQQLNGLCSEVMLEECFPFCTSCCEREQKGVVAHEEEEEFKSRALVIGEFFCTFIGSEIVLYTMHVSTIIIGAVKEGRSTMCKVNINLLKKNTQFIT